MTDPDDGYMVYAYYCDPCEIRMPVLAFYQNFVENELKTHNESEYHKKNLAAYKIRRAGREDPRDFQ